MKVSLEVLRTMSRADIGCAHVEADWESQNRPEENKATKKPVLMT